MNNFGETLIRAFRFFNPWLRVFEAKPVTFASLPDEPRLGELGEPCDICQQAPVKWIQADPLNQKYPRKLLGLCDGCHYGAEQSTLPAGQRIWRREGPRGYRQSYGTLDLAGRFYPNLARLAGDDSLRRAIAARYGQCPEVCAEDDVPCDQPAGHPGYHSHPRCCSICYTTEAARLMEAHPWCWECNNEMRAEEAANNKAEGRY